MTTVLTNDLLQEISVRCASRFITKQASLAEAIADESKSHELNKDQIQRVIETTNTIAYLRQLQDSDDRTAEFPVADYNSVIGKMVLPSSPAITTNLEKISQDNTASEDYKNDREFKISDREKMAMLTKEAFKCKSVLEKMASDKICILQSILDTASDLIKSDNGLEKLAYVSDEIDYDSLVKLCGFEKQASKTDLVFKDVDLVSANRLCGLYKQARELVAEEQKLKDSLSKAASILEGAGYHVGNAFGSAARVGGSAAINTAGRAATTTLSGAFTKNPTGFRRFTRALGGAAMNGLSVTHNNSVWGSLN